MSKSKNSIVIIGAGVVGFSIGIALFESMQNLRITILEKESRIGSHASGRNSGVLHAGFYYSPDSLKARFCREGNRELKELCRSYKIPLLETGKVVVAANNYDNSQLDLLFERGLKNNVELELLDAKYLKGIEPLTRTIERFLWSPTTAVSDPNLIILALKNEFLKRGGEIQLSTKSQIMKSGNNISVNNLKSSIIINAAGAQADRLARKVGIGKEFAMIPFMGVYKTVPIEKLPLRRLVYPVPHPVNPFLGVHFTLTIDKKVKIGPTAIPVMGREQYSLKEGWSLSDSVQALRGAFSLIKGDEHDFSKLVRNEMPKIFSKNLLAEATGLVPSAGNVSGWRRKPPGIRSQLVNLKNGKLEQDFIVEVKYNSVHILNAVSPGWTCALPFGRYVAIEKVLPLI